MCTKTAEHAIVKYVKDVILDTQHKVDYYHKEQKERPETFCQYNKNAKLGDTIKYYSHKLVVQR